MLMFLSTGFGLVTAIGISQVLGQKSTNAEPEMAMGPVITVSADLDPNSPFTNENIKIENYISDVIKADLKEPGDMDIITKVQNDFRISKLVVHGEFVNEEVIDASWIF